MKRREFTAKGKERCVWVMFMRDGAEDDRVNCSRRKVVGDFCVQHAKMIDAEITQLRKHKEGEVSHG